MARLSIMAISLVAFGLLGGAGPACAEAQKTPASIYKDYIHGVFTIHAGAILGTGFVVSPGLVATNAHVVGNTSVVEVEAQDGTKFQATVIQKDVGHDYAILKPNGIRPFTTTVSLPLGPTPAIGESIVVIGSPGGMKGTVTAGIVSQIYPDGMIQLNVSVNPGNSGGPVFDAQGRVFGMATFKYSQGDGIGFATPVRWLDAGQMGR
jgi:serine protease Do